MDIRKIFFKYYPNIDIDKIFIYSIIGIKVLILWKKNKNIKKAILNSYNLETLKFIYYFKKLINN
jgi:hypothetical protein